MTPQLSENAVKVLEKRYLARNQNGDIVETPEALFRRVANACASADKKFGKSQAKVEALSESFYQSMALRQFLPNSPTLMNAGKSGGQLSACFVLPVPDNLEGIFETCKNAAIIHKTGGGTGFSFSRLRPQNDPVETHIGVASGPVSFMTVYDAATEAIRQGGTRRGANMGILRVDHPDIELFVHCKRDQKKLNNFNISVGITDAFIKAVKEDKDFELLNPSTGKVVKTIKARVLFARIAENAHATGEPGLIFLDRINQLDPLIESKDDNGHFILGTENIEATNPCGEQPLGPGDACNLGSINVAEFVSGNDFDFAALETMVSLAVHFLDNIVEINHWPMDFIAAVAKAYGLYRGGCQSQPPHRRGCHGLCRSPGEAWLALRLRAGPCQSRSAHVFYSRAGA